MSFDKIGLDQTILESISYMGFEAPTPIQAEAIPVILEGRDLIGCAQTGTGKTGAFILPVLHQVINAKQKGCKALIIVPTRELALQIDQQIEGFSYFTNVHSIPIYGGGSGSDFARQKQALKDGADIIIATPGKLISHLNMGYVQFDTIEHLILDEADRMLDMGFIDDIKEIISHLPKKRQSLFFSATMAPKIRSFAKGILQDPYEINLALSKPAEGVLQAIYLVYNEHKNALLNSLLLDKPTYKSILVFTSTKDNVHKVYRYLQRKHDDVAYISSDLDQSEREEVMRGFRSKRVRILVATDVISRGIDIKDINLVINYDVPRNAEDYVHRVGRTARADTTGVAITFVNPRDMPAFAEVEALIGNEIQKLPTPEEIGQSPRWNPKGDRSGGRDRKSGGRGRFSRGGSKRRDSGGSRRRGQGQKRRGRRSENQDTGHHQSQRNAKKSSGQPPKPEQ